MFSAPLATLTEDSASSKENAIRRDPRARMCLLAHVVEEFLDSCIVFFCIQVLGFETQVAWLMGFKVEF